MEQKNPVLAKCITTSNFILGIIIFIIYESLKKLCYFIFCFIFYKSIVFFYHHRQNTKQKVKEKLKNGYFVQLYSWLKNNV